MNATTASMLLGRHATDRITGFSGVIVGYVEYLTQCNQALLSPKVGKDGAVRESAWFDVQRLVIDMKKSPIVLDNGKTPGCFDRPAPKR